MRALCIAAISFLATAARAAPPAAPIHPVEDHYFGESIIDPYRWMEDEKSPELAPWLAAEASFTQGRLATIPGRERLLARIAEIDRGSTRVTSLKRYAGRYFYLKSDPGAPAARLYVRDIGNTAERVVVDPNASVGDKTPGGSIDYFQPSWDGKWIGYAISHSGSEDSTIRIVETATGRVLSDDLGHCTICSFTWLPDDKSLFYIRANPEPGQRYSKTRAYLHTINSDGQKDPAVFGYGVSKAIEFGASDFPFFFVDPDSRYLVAMAHHGVQEEMTAWVAPLEKWAGAATPWQKIFDVPDAVTSFDLHGDQLFTVDHKESSRYRIRKSSLSKPDLAKASELVPAGDGVIMDIGIAGDSLYYKVMEGGPSRVRQVPQKGGAPSDVPLPFTGAVIGEFTDPRDPAILIQLTGWTHSALWLSYDPRTHKTVDTALCPPSPLDYSDIETVEVKARSADGTMVPLSILARRGLVHDGSHPTLVEGYGSHGIALEPHFFALHLAWLERGGVLAYAHPRGGGEYGEAWHRGGQKDKKRNSITDFIACLQYLIDEKYTSSTHLGIAGASAGGVLIGGTLTERPDLIAAAVSEVGVHNMLRLEAMDTGGANVPEYGSVATIEGYKARKAMDVYHQIKDGTRYPAVLLRAAVNDARVPLWQVAKMAARLQAATTGSAPILLYVEAGTGHKEGAGSALHIQLADIWSFLLWQLGDPAFQPPKS